MDKVKLVEILLKAIAALVAAGLSFIKFIELLGKAAVA